MKINEQRKQIIERMERQADAIHELRRAGSVEEFHSTRLDDERLLAVLDIAEGMSPAEIARIKAIPAYKNDWSEVKDIKNKYELSWNELKWIQRIEF